MLFKYMTIMSVALKTPIVRFTANKSEAWWCRINSSTYALLFSKQRFCRSKSTLKHFYLLLSNLFLFYFASLIVCLFIHFFVLSNCFYSTCIYIHFCYVYRIVGMVSATQSGTTITKLELCHIALLVHIYGSLRGRVA